MRIQLCCCNSSLCVTICEAEIVNFFVVTPPCVVVRVVEQVVSLILILLDRNQRLKTQTTPLFGMMDETDPFY